ncbi:hypothetical protein E4K10_03430 [Streptomyces sp. T1317-0309]|nr:hypothetical protein E4K10_03430 [Streptomyces sp. T1317-0309]
MILEQLRRRRGRALALAAGILVASTSFTLLTATVDTSKATTVTVRKTRGPRTTSWCARRTRRRTWSGAADWSHRTSCPARSAHHHEPVPAYRRHGRHRRGRAGRQHRLPDGDEHRHRGRVRFLDSKASRQILRINPTLTSGLGTYRTSDEYVYLTRSP